MPRPRFQFSIGWMMAIAAVVASVCWINREVPFFAILGATGILFCCLGDGCLRLTREASWLQFAGGVIDEASSLAIGVWFLAISLLGALAHHASFD
jgi:hypothetical protein